MKKQVESGDITQEIYQTFVDKKALHDKLADAQKDWLEKTLSQSKATWLLVAGH
jgi:phosphodiesterase/alkaline phosphatase D-like protein